MLTDTRRSPNAKIVPLQFRDVVWTGGFWKERTDTCANVTVPHLQRMFESKDISHIVENFRICTGDAEGGFAGTAFGDGDFYKWMEAAVYAAVGTNNQSLLDKLDEFIELLGRAQQADGYLSTKQIIGAREQNGACRMGDINDFEVYNFGHLFTAACLHKRLTGKDNFLIIAEKAADYLERLYAHNSRTGKAQTAVCPSHYMGLVELYRTTGEKRYLRLAEQAVALRDCVQNGLDDNQDRVPMKQQKAIIGHAVRANYLYAGVADLCAEETDSEYFDLLHRMWRSLVDKKMYLTGGCGALYNGASPYGNFFSHQLIHQAYGYEYQLPNITAYNETCASLGGVFWAYRMFLLEPKAEYFDVLERMMLNTNLAAVSLDGKRFFYENMLRRTKHLDYDLIWPLTRSEYISSYCCPPNLARTICESSEYAYLVSDDAVWTGLYGASSAKIHLHNGADFTLVQNTDYPWDGKIRFTFKQVKNSAPFHLNIRVPGWVENGFIRVNNETNRPLGREQAGTYQTVLVENPNTDSVEVSFPMKARFTVANPMVEEDINQIAVEYGPLVYCSETPDSDAGSLDDLLLDPGAVYRPEQYEIAGRKILALQTEAYCLNRKGFDRNALYQTFHFQGMKKEPLRFIPYFAWDNRGVGEMRVWFPMCIKTETKTPQYEI